MTTPHFELGDEVRDALRRDRPVVALESTLVAHGMPYPANLETALEVEDAIRRAGAVPATVAVLDGRLRVGLSPAELERVARSPDLPKATIRDLPVLCALGRSAATTVASTAQVAAWVGIDVFVTGGIGGVHRGWQETLDVSADLPTLARLSLVVVSAGAKTVLDVAATLEYLETHGVTVLGYGTDEFPGFYLRSTGLPVDARIDSPAEAAAVLRARRALGLPGAVLVANPIPPGDALDDREFARWLAQAEADRAAQGIKGKAVTPYLLERLHALSGGRTVAANRALVLNNARLGAAIARSLAGLSPEPEDEGGEDGRGRRGRGPRAGAIPGRAPEGAARPAAAGVGSRDEPALRRARGAAAAGRIQDEGHPGRTRVGAARGAARDEGGADGAEDGADAGRAQDGGGTGGAGRGAAGDPGESSARVPATDGSARSPQTAPPGAVRAWAGAGAVAAFVRRWLSSGAGSGRGPAMGAPATPGGAPPARSR